jgi:hypothetical protein
MVIMPFWKQLFELILTFYSDDSFFRDSRMDLLDEIFLFAVAILFIPFVAKGG